MIVVAIDGPSGSGKSSTAKSIAQRAGWSYLDTGALYRAVTWLALKNNATSPDQILLCMIDNTIKFNSSPIDPRVFCGDIDVTTEIRTDVITENVSRISALAEVRHELLTIQRKIISQADRGIVVEGRDIGTVVAPKAPLKIFLTADLEARANRRAGELVSDTKSLD